MILIVDFGSQTAHLIGRRLRGLGVDIAYAMPAEAMVRAREASPLGVILSGGPSSVYEDGAPAIDPEIFMLGVPILGICYGWQLMASLLGGQVKSAHKEYGPEDIHFTHNIFNLASQACSVFMSHGDSVVSLPKGFQVVGSTKNMHCAAVMDAERQFFGLQFHPEVDHTEHGSTILEHFAKCVCKCATAPIALDPSALIEKIRQQVGDSQVICGVSGGVDSTVAAFLIAKAIGSRLHPVYIDSGLMREGTTEKVRYIFSELVDAPPTIVEARKCFIEALKGIEEPEQKRKIIGKLYIDLFEEQSIRHPAIKFLAQGTIYSDVIESKGSTHASQIKSHHNVGGLPKEMSLQLLEPLRQFYKDEVREIGALSGLPRQVLMEHPFPGPGYAVRIRGEVTALRLAQVKRADDIVMEEIQLAGLYDSLFQCFALMTGAFSTAVKGDSREFAEVVCLRAYESSDVMTSQWAKLPYDLLQKISSRIVNEVPKVSRVVYDITTKPPATMEWE